MCAAMCGITRSKQNESSESSKHLLMIRIAAHRAGWRRTLSLSSIRTEPSRSSCRGSYRLNPAGGGVILSAALLKCGVFSHDLSAPVSHYIQLFLFPQTRCGRKENPAWIQAILDSGGKPIQTLLGRRVYNDPNCASVSSKNRQFNHSNLHTRLKLEQFYTHD